LVLVLGFLVLISALVVAFMGNVRTERVASGSFATGVTTRQLAETATNLAIAQIADATAGFSVPGDTKSEVLSWATQPGMVRTYRDTGEPFRYYKLYSARNMVMTSVDPAFNVNSEFALDVPADWHENPAVFTDLNAPIAGTGGIYNYPIVDPTMQKSGASTNDGVEGFEIMKGPGFSGSSTRPTTTQNTLATPGANPAMMPARWLYVLRDGTLTPAPEPSGSEGKLSWGTAEDLASRPSKENPIVGRVAFWTDDETAKINVNTASEGTFWDRPWGGSGNAEENNFANFIPGQGEYQRYAGHPATTCLSSVFSPVIPLTPTKKEYYWLVPRTMNGGTNAGTTETNAGNSGLGSDYERLFASVDELVYNPVFSGTQRSVPNTNVIPTAKAKVFADWVRRSKFFLTVSNRAPDVNLFNKPRVSLWPVHVNETKERNPKDKLIAFCGTTGAGTVNEAKYFIQRFNSYIEGSALKGDGRTSFINPMPSSCHPTMDWWLAAALNTKPSRNQELYAYLQDLTQRNIPGFGGSLKAKYDQLLPVDYSERDQILTMMFDYIRTNVNAYSTSQNLTPQYDYAPTRRGGPVAGETQLVPLVLRDRSSDEKKNITKGFGRFATVTEAALVFYVYKDSANVRWLRAHLILEPFNPSPGNASWSPHVRYVVKNLEKIKVGGQAFIKNGQDNAVELGFPGPIGGVYPFNWITSRVGYSGGGHKMAFMGLRAAFQYFKDGGSDQPKIPGFGGAENEYPFYTPGGARIENSSATSFTIAEPVVLDVEIYSGYEKIEPTGNGLTRRPKANPRPDLLVQRLHIPFPASSFPIPMPGEETTEFSARIADNGASMLKATDAVRSVEVRPDQAAAGDLRMMCALFDVPKEFFVEHPNALRANQKMAHSLRSRGFNSPGSEGNATISLVTGATYGERPAAAARVTQAKTSLGLQGDFDNATGSFEDGAYVNKADEGNISTGADSYFGDGSFNVEDGRTHSPNRQIASAVAFGSLPTGVKATEYSIRENSPKSARPWETLLFTANPLAGAPSKFESGSTKHFGFGSAKTTATNIIGSKNQPPYVTPPDHLWLDLFTMPVIEPYANSEPFSTQGRVNLNYQIAPFTYIKRTTGLNAVLKSTKLAAIPQTDANKQTMKRHVIDPAVGPVDSVPGEYAANAKLDGATKGTLNGFQRKFNDGDIFRSASQICDISLIPKGAASYDTIDTFWNNNNKRTGDNVREIPYGHIYPRVTTKSNTFTVHMRVQALKKSSVTAPDEWMEGVDQVAGEYRGSTTLERYIDAADPALPDFAKLGTTDNLDRHYRIRILNTKAFVH
jgi:uncharacterized protein (TIGR02600 family)